MKLTLGAMRVLGIRVLQFEAYLAMVLMWIGIKPGLLAVVIYATTGVAYVLLDYFKLWTQEQNFAGENIGILQRIEKLLKEK